ncbi:FixH family protein [Zavarzinia sp. CC-PAN008]|uniref:FixH family protein n=1 Tax=Zavarzinia sp. CC-PAN008 TaxID=3243332 RepID=UPI003F7430EC
MSAHVAHGRFTGWHMTGILVAFFGVVIAVNLLMATFAVSTFGGKVVENSYVASQNFNAWLAQARAQDAQGWTLDAGLDPERRLMVQVRAAVPVEGARVQAVAAHPLGQEPDRAIVFHRTAEGAFLAEEPLPEGRWIVRLSVQAGANEARFVRDVNTRTGATWDPAAAGGDGPAPGTP